jgi:fibronectin-binding autotransporter adhesin
MKRTLVTKPIRTLVVALAVAALSASGAYAANGTWTNAPASGEWTNVLNWNGGVVPGTINNTANNGIDSASIAFFTNAITTFGGAANPVTPDDATVVNGKARMMGRVVFDGPDCGAYVFSSPSPYAAQTATTPETGVLSLCVPTGGGLGISGSYITATVIKPQTFLVPVQIRLPSSTTGVYGFTNNATSLDATYYFQRLFLYPGGTGRGVTYVFSGSNTGTNTVALLEQSVNQTGSPSGIRKNGTGRWILSGANTFNNGSAMNIDEGTLEVLDPAAFGAVTTTVNVNTNGILQINGVTLNAISIALKNSGTVRMNGTASLNGVNVNNGVGNTPVLATTSANDVFTVGTGLAAAAVVAGGAADSVLNTAGPGTLVFSQANTYVGKWSFNARTNQLSSSSALGTGPNANVGAGAILDLTPLGASSFVPTTAGFGGSGIGSAVGTTAAAVVADAGGTLDLTGKNVNLTFTPTSFSGDLARPALHIAQGGLTLGGNTFFIDNASGTPLGVGTYRLITQASGSITSGGGYAALISGSGAVGGSSAAIVVSGGNVDLVIDIYVPKNLVWSGTGANWDVGSTADWLNGAIASVFNNSDNVTFNSVGAANPIVNLVGTVAPATVTVDTGANGYTFSGSGQVAGTTALKKINAGTFDLQTVNTYAGGTVVSNGTLRIGANNAISSTGSGDVAVYSPGSIDLNGFNNTINGLSGNGTVDVTSGGASILTVGNNDNSGTFSGPLQNASGTLALVKAGLGSQTLSAANTLAGGVTLSGGTLVAANPGALGTNIATVNAGTLELPNSIQIGGLAGAGGVVANNTTATTNTIVIDGGNTATFGGSVVDGSGGGGLAVKILSGSQTFSAINTYSGGTIVGSGATFGIANSPAAVGGTLIASNNATLALSGGSGTPGTPNTVTTVDGATVSFTSGALGKIWAAQFVGGVNSTNRILNPMSFGGDTSFKSFLGVVQFEAAGNARFINIPGGTAGGSDNTTFEWVGATAVVTRDAATVRLGHIRGGNSASGIDGATTAGVIDTYIIGGKNVDSLFQGYFRGSNNLVKIGSAKLIFDGAAVTTNTDAATYTNYLYGDTLVAHTLNTTISNGTLGLVVPNNLSNSPVITLAGTAAVLDVSKMGFVQDQLDEFLTVTNQVLVTNGVLQLQVGQTLAGIGSVQGALVANSGSTINPGLSTGVLAISGSASLNGAVNIGLDRAATPVKNGRLTAASFSGSGATLTITNLGATLVTGDTFQLFSGAVTAFSTINLPAASADNSITYVWEDKIAIDGTIKVLSGASPVDPTPTNITSSVSGNVLTLAWPSSHTGWTLQAQTNSLSTGLSGAWFDVAGSTTTNQVFVTINPANPTVFYRLTLPQP